MKDDVPTSHSGRDISNLQSGCSVQHTVFPSQADWVWFTQTWRKADAEGEREGSLV